MRIFWCSANSGYSGQRQSVKKWTGTLAGCGFMFVLALFLPGCGSKEHAHHHHSAAEMSAKDQDRWMWQLPGQVLDSIGVETGMTVADVGAGYGYFTFPLAQRVGKQGVVYANEINKSYLEFIQKRIDFEGVANVNTVLGSPDDPLLPDSQMDLVLMVNVIHLVENKEIFLQNVKSSIKPSGVLAIVQWEASKLAATAPEGGLSNLDEFDSENLLKLIDDSGYDVGQIFKFLPKQDIIMCYPRDGRNS